MSLAGASRGSPRGGIPHTLRHPLGGVATFSWRLATKDPEAAVGETTWSESSLPKNGTMPGPAVDSPSSGGCCPYAFLCLFGQFRAACFDSPQMRPLSNSKLQRCKYTQSGFVHCPRLNLRQKFDPNFPEPAFDNFVFPFPFPFCLMCSFWTFLGPPRGISSRANCRSGRGLLLERGRGCIRVSTSPRMLAISWRASSRPQACSSTSSKNRFQISLSASRASAKEGALSPSSGGTTLVYARRNLLSSC